MYKRLHLYPITICPSDASRLIMSFLVSIHMGLVHLETRDKGGLYFIGIKSLLLW